MSWDDAYRQLEQELGRQPRTDEVQIKMLEMAQGKVEKLKND
ncbi:MAG: hypothetical protein ACYST6_10270 [Planctomycetota bacterium]|jgi:hypothetical protein